MKDTIVFDDSHPIRGSPQIGAFVSNLKKFSLLLKGSEKVLLKISSVFPFDFFPDEVTIDECKVNIVFHDFFLSEDIHSITIDMIKDIEIEAGPIFATMKIVPDGYPGQPLTVRFLKKGDAIKIRRIIQGLMVAKRQGVDLINLDLPGFAEKIESLGKTHLAE